MKYSHDNVFEGDFIRSKYEGDSLMRVTETDETGFKSESSFGEHIHLPYSDIKELLLESEGYDEYYS